MASLRSLLIPDNEDPTKKAVETPPMPGSMGGQPAPTGAPMPAPAGGPQPPAGVMPQQPVTAPAPTAPPSGVVVKKRVAAPPPKSAEDIAREKLETILSPSGAKAGERVKLENAQLAADIEQRTAAELPNAGNANLNAPTTTSPAMEREARLGKGFPALQYKPRDIVEMPELLDSKASKRLAGQFKLLIQTGRSASSVLREMPDLPSGEQSSKLAKDALIGAQPRTAGGMLVEGMDPLADVSGRINKQDIFSDAVRVARAIVTSPTAKQGQKDSAIQAIVGMSAYLNGDTEDPGVFSSAHTQLAGAGMPTAKPDRGGLLAEALGSNPIYKKFFATTNEKTLMNQAETNKTFGSAARKIAGTWLSAELTKLDELAVKGVTTDGPEAGRGVRTGVQKQAQILRRLLGGFQKEADAGAKIQVAVDNPFNTYITRRITAAFHGSKGVDKESAKQLAGMAGASDSAAKQIADMFGINKELQNIASFDFRGRETEFASAADRAMIFLNNGQDDKAAQELAPYMNKVQKRIFFPGVDIEVYGSTPNQFGIDTAEEVAARGIGDTSSRRTATESNISNMKTALTKDKQRDMTYAANPDDILLGVGRSFGIDTTTTLFGKRDVDKDLAVQKFDPDVAMEDLDQLLRVTVDDDGVAYGDKLHDNTMNAMRGLVSKIDDRLVGMGKDDVEYKQLTEFKEFLNDKLDDTSEMLDRSNSSAKGQSSSPFFERLGSGNEADFSRPKEVTGKQRLAQGFDIIDAWVNKRGDINAANYFSGVDLDSAQVSRATKTLTESRTNVRINPVNAYGEFIKDAPVVTVDINNRGESVIPVYEKKTNAAGEDVWVQSKDPKTGEPLTQSIVIPVNERERFGFSQRTDSTIAGALSGSRYGMSGAYIALQARQMHAYIRDGLAEGAPGYGDRRKYFANLIGRGYTPETIASISDTDFAKFLKSMNREQGNRLIAFTEDISRQGGITGDLRASSSYNATSTRGKSKGIDDRVVSKISRGDIGTMVSDNVSTATRSLLRISQTIDRNASPDDTPEQAAKKVQDVITSEADKIPDHIRAEFLVAARRLTSDIQSGQYEDNGIAGIKSTYADGLAGPAKLYWEKNADIVPTRVVSDGQILISPGKGRGDDIRTAKDRAGESVSKTIAALIEPANASRTTAFVDSLDDVSRERVKLALKQLKTTVVGSDPDIQLQSVLRDELNGMIRRGIKIDPDTLTVDVPDYLKPSSGAISEAQLADEAREAVSGIKKAPTLGELDPKAQYVLDQKQSYYKLQKLITTGWAIAQTTGDPEDYQRFLKRTAGTVPTDILNKVVALNKDLVKGLGGDDKAWSSLGIGYDTETKTITGLNDPRFLAAFERQWKKIEPSIAANMPPIKYKDKEQTLDIEASRKVSVENQAEAEALEGAYKRNQMSPEMRRKAQRAKATELKGKATAVQSAVVPQAVAPVVPAGPKTKQFSFDSPLLKGADIRFTAEDRDAAKVISDKLGAAKNKAQLLRLAKALGVTVEEGAVARRASEAAARQKEIDNKKAAEAKIASLKTQTPQSKAAATKRTPPPTAQVRRAPQPPVRPVQVTPTPTATPQPPRRPASTERTQGALIRNTRRGRGVAGLVVQTGQMGQGFAGKLGSLFGGRNATGKTKK